MKELILNVEIIFQKKAKEFFVFPITNSVRLSFWLPEDKVSTFSEIILQNKSIEVGVPENVMIKIIEREFLANRIRIGSEFRMGVFPNEILVGRVVGL